MTSPSVDAGVFTPEEQALLKKVERSQVWRLMRDALCWERENLFAEEPDSTEKLWLNRGAIKQVQRLLHDGPRFVVYYRRFMDEQTGERVENAVENELRERAANRMTADEAPEREFNPGGEPPDFDH